MNVHDSDNSVMEKQKSMRDPLRKAQSVIRDDVCWIKQ